MAISNLLFKPFPTLNEPKLTIQTNRSYSYHSNKLALWCNFRCKNSIRTDNNTTPRSKQPSLFKDQDYKVSWQEELKRAYPFEISDEEYLQELVDKRCVENVRMLIVDSVQHAKAGHGGMALGMAEIAYFLYRHAMRYNSRNPKWFNRDRFVLSAGHGSLLHYVCLHLAGFQSVQIEDLKRLCKLGSRTPGHPENGVTEGIEVTTGPLGQGVANAVGLALAEAHLAARFNKPDIAIVDHRTYCIMGDGCSMEGISNEAASLAAHWKLHKLTLIYDFNHNTIDGSTDLAVSEDISARFEALGWNTIIVDNTQGNIQAFKSALISAHSETEKPTFIRVKTRIGKLSKKEGTSKAHHGTFDEDDVKQMKQKVKWDDREPFHVIPMVYREMQAQTDLGGRLEQEWNSKLYYYQSKYPEEAAEFELLLADGMLPGWESSLPKWSMSDPVDATRGYSGKCLNVLAKVLPGLIGGSADLASSNQAYLHNLGDFKQPDSPWGRNIRYGVREHAMAGISNGLALHGGGLIPFAATFLVFSDYMKNSIRLSALSRAGVIYIMTHDSIGLGEDGPTHQPVEHLAGLRAVPHLLLFRPADGNETAGAYKVAVENRDVPSLIALSRQKVATNVEGTSTDAVEKGGYIISDNSEELPEIILIGTGSELCLCEASANVLRNEGRRVRVVSLVCWRLFDRQPRDYKELVLPSNVSKRVSVEAGSPLGWKEYVGDEGVVIGIDDFGASGPYSEVFKKYGFTEENVTQTAKSLLSK
uniref:transketolase n=3 Tax=Nicotiana TaxID=4085 RepID=A0A1S3ZUI6_TOBAC|nr:PREDICTED: transketolase, chloroplastic-like [Nicotiana sylvestris]XP_016468084.1 PREDICTED: transketolase, chloroplastic-like isoform X1 [Nicotiana tabacum]XP_016468085.1 PREDICTED: transketolase, chloroplastic-like isoform X2 [Nicotiana tabacum]